VGGTYISQEFEHGKKGWLPWENILRKRNLKPGEKQQEELLFKRGGVLTAGGEKNKWKKEGGGQLLP